ncbi:MAG: hypothetical protein KBT13_03310 [Bacteroidales bacterium]|nr:hypothetical protein [Candidatus Sodaliphilus limicaballi]
MQLPMFPCQIFYRKNGPRTVPRDEEQLNQTENNMPPKKRKSQTNAKKAIANMGANMAAMMSPASPVTDTQPVNAEGTEIGSVETTLSPVPDNPPVTNPDQDAKVQSAESAEYNDIPETEEPLEHVGGSEWPHLHMLK